MERLQITTRLDWLTVSSHNISQPLDILPRFSGVGILEEIRPLPNYQTAFRVSPGGMVCWADNERQGTVLRLSGDQLELWRSAGLPTRELLEHSSSDGRRITRLDFAVDIFGGGKPQHLINHFKAGNVKTRFRDNPQQYYRLNDRSSTVYFGSRKSNNYLRVYDKASETRQLWLAWVRIELEMKRQRAINVAQAMLTSGVDVAGKQAIRQLIEVPKLRWFTYALAGDTSEILPIPRPIEAWQRWLTDQVQPVLQKHSEEPENREYVIGWIIDVLESIQEPSSDNN